jgi:hypothetical protein
MEIDAGTERAESMDLADEVVDEEQDDSFKCWICK